MESGFVLAYFKTDDESLYLAASSDGLSYAPLVGERPVLRSQLGNCSIRDPFIFRIPGDKFVLLATDGFHGKSIFFAQSHDLVNWFGFELLKPFGTMSMARNLWAPKAVIRDSGDVEIFWSTTTSVLPFGVANDHRIWSMATSDFRRFSKPMLRFDPGYNIIDFCPFLFEGKLHALFKDERGTCGKGEDRRALRSVVESLHGISSSIPSDLLTETGSEGPCLFRLDNRWACLYDRYTKGCWGGMVSPDFVTWERIAVEVPFGARHGSVLSL